MTAAVSPSRRWRRFFAVAVVTLLMLVVAAYFAGMPVAREMLRKKLQALVSDHLYARLDMGTLTYRFPYGVVASDVALVTTLDGQPPVTLASFKTLYLQLGKLPIGDGPLVIQTIDLDTPTLHVIRTPDGIAGRKLVRPKDSPKARTSKLSEVLQLQHVQITAGRVQYDDQTQAQSVPLLWEHLDLKLECQRKADDPSNYHFDFAGSSGDLADVSAAGAMDVDDWLLALESFVIDARVAAGSPRSPLPPQLQALLRRWQITGRVRFEADGMLPLTELATSHLNAKLHVQNGQGVLPGGLAEKWGDVDHLAIDAEAKYADARVTGRLAQMTGGTAILGLSAQPVDFTADPAANTWTLTPLRLTATFTPPPPYKTLRQPATLSLVAQARKGQTPGETQLDLAGTTLHIESIDETLRLAGTLRQSGDLVLLENGAIEGMNGAIATGGTHRLQSEQTQLVLRLAAIDAGKLKRLLDPAGPDAITGRLSGQIDGSIVSDHLDTVTAAGHLTVADGDFGKVPLLAKFAKTLHMGENLFVARDATANFTIGDRVIFADRLSVSTDAIRVKGSGKIGFDRTLDLAVYAGTTSDWGAGVKSTKIPLLSDLGGLLAGGAQTAIRSATKQLTSFKITGTIADPKITPAPLPIVGKEFEKLMQAEK